MLDTLVEGEQLATSAGGGHWAISQAVHWISHPQSPRGGIWFTIAPPPSGQRLTDLDFGGYLWAPYRTKALADLRSPAVHVVYDSQQSQKGGVWVVGQAADRCPTETRYLDEWVSGSVDIFFSGGVGTRGAMSSIPTTRHRPHPPAPPVPSPEDLG